MKILNSTIKHGMCFAMLLGISRLLVGAASAPQTKAAKVYLKNDTAWTLAMKYLAQNSPSDAVLYIYAGSRVPVPNNITKINAIAAGSAYGAAVGQLDRLVGYKKPKPIIGEAELAMLKDIMVDYQAKIGAHEAAYRDMQEVTIPIIESDGALRVAFGDTDVKTKEVVPAQDIVSASSRPSPAPPAAKIDPMMDLIKRGAVTFEDIDRLYTLTQEKYKHASTRRAAAGSGAPPVSPIGAKIALKTSMFDLMPVITGIDYPDDAAKREGSATELPTKDEVARCIDQRMSLMRNLGILVKDERDRLYARSKLDALAYTMAKAREDFLRLRAQYDALEADDAKLSSEKTRLRQDLGDFGSSADITGDILALDQRSVRALYDKTKALLGQLRAVATITMSPQKTPALMASLERYLIVLATIIVGRKVSVDMIISNEADIIRIADIKIQAIIDRVSAIGQGLDRMTDAQSFIDKLSAIRMALEDAKKKLVVALDKYNRFSEKP